MEFAVVEEAEFAVEEVAEAVADVDVDITVPIVSMTNESLQQFSPLALQHQWFWPLAGHGMTYTAVSLVYDAKGKKEERNHDQLLNPDRPCNKDIEYRYLQVSQT